MAAAAAAVVVAGTTDGATITEDMDTIMDIRAVVKETMVNPTPHLHLAGNLAVEVPVVEVLAAEEVQEDLLAAVLAVAAVPVVAVAAVLVVAVAAVPVVAAEEAVESSMTIFTANRIVNSQQNSLP
jgi:hypothetical protein